MTASSIVAELEVRASAPEDIPAITAAPLGMGAALLCFMPGQMTFEDYFKMEGHSEEERQIRFLVGLSPAMLQMGYLVDDSRVNLKAQKGPSTPTRPRRVDDPKRAWGRPPRFSPEEDRGSGARGRWRCPNPRS